ncbi:hypothetical protein [Colwellia sp. C1TZA3]|jgi:hypothetical protein|uniref:hypothetical protein n=1 Tax=Colwellia sp. C1TZA3 TaxID=2508879 RepID=UPI0011B9E4FA|nr:hypothetical protein [Colwellia sp. C1TZA3]TWX63732.1 hypothetical protein ESZ39_16675 [Colwellia sp. C1TZA3]
MNEQFKQVVDTIDNLKEQVKALEAQNNAALAFIMLKDFPELIESYCTDNSIRKADICVLAGISTTTLTQTLKNPLKASMSTINALSSVIGYQILIGRS